MEIAHRIEDGITVVSLRGRFDAPSAPDAETVFRQLTQEGAQRVVVDFSGVEYISSGGLRVIIMLSKALEKNNGQMALSGMNPFVSEVFEITNLATRYRILPSCEDAIRALRAES
ncbi:MAG: STAS domain-containing protein [Candidatus Hydrogenedentes bacterium]|nr:STAS domain-containing protein [Candidatus Hydrogenedentota bacterium]